MNNCLINRYNYPLKAYTSIKIPKTINYIPNLPDIEKFKINIIKTELPGIMTFKDTILINKEIKSWNEILNLHNLCHLAVVERHGKNGEFAHGFIKNFNLKKGQ